jgi:hypothetical protein
MKVTMTSRLRRNAAVIAAASIIGALGIGGVVTAHADNGSGGGSGSQTTEKSDGDGEVPDAQENDANEQGEGAEDPSDDAADGETNDDATDTGPDANPDEPGHQDASDTP